MANLRKMRESSGGRRTRGRGLRSPPSPKKYVRRVEDVVSHRVEARLILTPSDGFGVLRLGLDGLRGPRVHGGRQGLGGQVGGIRGGGLCGTVGGRGRRGNDKRVATFWRSLDELQVSGVEVAWTSGQEVGRLLVLGHSLVVVVVAGDAGRGGGRGGQGRRGHAAVAVVLGVISLLRLELDAAPGRGRGRPVDRVAEPGPVLLASVAGTVSGKGRPPDGVQRVVETSLAVPT
jgi:hypothetical protein